MTLKDASVFAVLVFSVTLFAGSTASAKLNIDSSDEPIVATRTMDDCYVEESACIDPCYSILNEDRSLSFENNDAWNSCLRSCGDAFEQCVASL
jgi:hypothetical protein